MRATRLRGPQRTTRVKRNSKVGKKNTTRGSRIDGGLNHPGARPCGFEEVTPSRPTPPRLIPLSFLHRRRRHAQREYSILGLKNFFQEAYTVALNAVSGSSTHPRGIKPDTPPRIPSRFSIVIFDGFIGHCILYMIYTKSIKQY